MGLTGGEPASTAAAEAAFRSERAAVLATLIRQVGDFQLAEDALQDAFAAAIASWSRRRRARSARAPGSRWRRAAARSTACGASAASPTGSSGCACSPSASRARDEEDEEPGIVDDRLRLIFTCCHPALALEARVALTLRSLGGLTTGEIARAFLVAEPAMAQRLVRAKRKIRRRQHPLSGARGRGAARAARRCAGRALPDLQRGLTATGGERLVRGELCSEAIRLGRLLYELMPDEPEVAGLLALMLLHDSRREARVDSAGRPVLLDDQDRSLWDRGRIREGERLLEAAFRRRRPGVYQLQAAIAAVHATAPSPDDTDWEQIAGLYGALAELTPSPIVELNRAVAVGRASGPPAGLELLSPLLASGQLAEYAPLHVAHADLLERSGDAAGAAEAYRRAAARSDNEVTRADLERRAARL